MAQWSLDTIIKDTPLISPTLSLDELERLAHHIEAALAYSGDTHSLVQVVDAIKDGSAQFFPLENSVIVTEVVDYPKKSVCRIWLAGGNMDELVEAEKKIVPWAKSHGCSGMEIIGRKGWERQLKDYNAASTVLIKEI
jgi:hypothetical protein